MACILMGLFHGKEKLTASPSSFEKDIEAGEVVTQVVTLTSNKPGLRTVSISAVVTPPQGGQADDLELLTTSAEIVGSTAVALQFRAQADLVAADYQVEVRIT